MTILVTGCAGLIGANFVNWLLENTEHQVVGIDNLSGNSAANLPLDMRFKFYVIDVCNQEKIDDIYRRYRPKVTYHLAAYAAEGRSNYIRGYINSNNTVGAASIINACVNHESKLIFTSSIAVYSGEPPFAENIEPNPIDEYGLSKYCTERSIQIAGKEQGLSWVIIRPRNVYGEMQNLFDPARNLFGIFCYNAINKKPLTIFGDGNNKRAFTYIGDILEPLYKSINYEKQIINLGSEKVYTINQAAEIFSEVTGYDNIIYVEPRHEVPEAYCLIHKSQQLLGYEDKTTLYAGLKKMWAWAKKQDMKDLMIPPALEVTKTNHSSIK